MCGHIPPSLACLAGSRRDIGDAGAGAPAKTRWSRRGREAAPASAMLLVRSAQGLRKLSVARCGLGERLSGGGLRDPVRLIHNLRNRGEIVRRSAMAGVSMAVVEMIVPP